MLLAATTAVVVTATVVVAATTAVVATAVKGKQKNENKNDNPPAGSTEARTIHKSFSLKCSIKAMLLYTTVYVG